MKNLMHRGSLKTVAFILMTTFLLGCAGSKEFKQVQGKVSNQSAVIQKIERQLAQQTAQMQALQRQQTNFKTQQNQQWETFAKAYTPAIREELASNLKTSQKHNTAVMQLKNASQKDRDQIKKSRKASAADLAAIKQNRKDATVENVVNTFNQLQAEFANLKRVWDVVVVQMQKESASHRDSVKRVTIALGVAVRDANDAKHAAYEAQKDSQKVNHFRHLIHELEDSIDKSEREMKKMHDNAAKYRKISQSFSKRIQKLEQAMKKISVPKVDD